MLEGIGFTMSLFVGALAFPDLDTRNVAKIGVMLASVLSGLGGSIALVLLARSARQPRRPPSNPNR